MSEFEDRLNSILGDPAQMEKISHLAKTLMGGGEAPPAEEPGGPANPENGELGLDPKLLMKLGRLMSRDSGHSSANRALLEAMRPYLSEKRRSRMDRALGLARLAKVAQLAMGELREDSDV